MDGHRCHRCGNYWASHAGDTDRFRYITNFCPNCLPLICDQRLDNAGPPPPRVQHYRHRPALIQHVGDTSKQARRAG